MAKLGRFFEGWEGGDTGIHLTAQKKITFATVTSVDATGIELKQGSGHAPGMSV